MDIHHATFALTACKNYSSSSSSSKRIGGWPFGLARISVIGSGIN